MTDATPYQNQPAKIVRWIDGDTVELDVDLGYKIHGKLIHRLLWLDTKERFTAEGKRATAEVNVLAPFGTSVRVNSFKPADDDKYGRWLAEVMVDGISINQYLLEHGFAVPYDGGTRA